MAVDQRDAAIDRLHWVWQLLIDLPPFLSDCVQLDGQKDVVSVVFVGTTPGSVYLLLTCLTNDLFSLGLSLAVNGPGSPAVKDRIIYDSSTDWPGSSIPKWWALDPAPSSTLPIIVTFQNGSSMTVLNEGANVTTFSMSDAILTSSLSRTACALTESKIFSFVPTGPLLASWDAVRSRTVLVVPGDSMLSSGPRYWIAAFALQSDRNLTALWCIAIPGVDPVTGQMSLIEAVVDSILVIPLANKIYGLGIQNNKI